MLIKQNPRRKKNLTNRKSTELFRTLMQVSWGSILNLLSVLLGYDWKIGIALITSFAAREVFVGTMATLYSVGDDEDENSLLLREKMQQAKRSDGSKVYTLATGVSLMIFYVFAMQCMSTLAIVKRETSLEMAGHSTCLYDGPGLSDEFYCIPVV